MSTSEAADVEVVHVRVDRAIAELTLDSPENRNALSRRLTAQLSAHLSQLAADDGVRAVVLGHTGNTFCAGADLSESAAEGGPARGTARMVDLLRQMVEFPKPLITRIDGAVRGGGLGLVGACDLAVATAGSTFAFTEARLGVAPAVISLTVLPRLTDRAAARWFLTGDRFDAAAGVRMGLLTEAVADADAMDDVVEALVDSMRRCSPQGLAASKGLLSEVLRPAFDERAEELMRLSAELFESDEAREGITAFLEQRPPAWAAG